MNSLIKLALMLMISSMAIFAQSGIIKGKVTDRNTNEPVVGATVEVFKHNISTTTDENGNYILKTVPEGFVDVYVSASGYKKNRKRYINMDKGETEVVDFELNNNLLGNYPRVLGSAEFDPLMSNNLNEKVHKELELIKELDEEKYRNLSSDINIRIPALRRGAYSSITSFTEEMETNYKIRELELRTERLALEYKKSKKDKAKTKQELTKVLKQLFELKEEVKSTEVKNLEEELAKLKEALKIRSKNKDKIIDNRLEELIGAGEYLDW